MEPFTTFSLACGIIQVVDTGIRVVKGCQELYKDGAVSKNVCIEDMTRHLTGLHSSLNVSNQRDSKELLELGKKCSDTVEDLVKLLQKLEVKRPRKKVGLIGKTLKTLWKKEAIDEIWKQLHDYKEILDTHILVDLRKGDYLLSVQQSKGFESLDKGIQAMFASLSASPKLLEDLATVIHRESQSVKDHVAYEFQQHQRSLAHIDYLKRFLESLWLPQINRRQETIKPAHAKTFNWIFDTDETRKKANQWTNFNQWLERGQGTYWISGKAGSGKSTLMKYISQDNRTHGLLKACLDRSRLQTTLRKVMRQLQESCRICVFIDGLDEFVGDQNALIATLEKLQSTEIKLCLSSRPDRLYSDAFSSFAKLKLQDLTETDITAFVSDKLQAPLGAMPAKDVTNFFNSIVRKAEGVFLWVELVVKDVLRSLRIDDSLDQLVKRVGLMPSGIEELYAHMLSNIERIHQRKAAELFHMALAGLAGSLLNVSLAHYKAFDQAYGISIQDAIRFCNLSKKRIPKISAGLLEIHIDEEQSEYPWGWSYSFLSVPVRYQPALELAELSLYERSTHVDFLHRTSVELLRESEQGRRFMEAHPPSSGNLYNSYVRALLAKVHLLEFPKITPEWAVDLKSFGKYATEEIMHRSFLFEVMRKAIQAEQHAGGPQVLLCEDIERTLTFVHQQRTDQSIKRHWCAQLSLCWTRVFMPHGRELLVEWRPSSQSSSTQSYHSAVSEQAEHDRLESLSTEPIDFLGLACTYGLSHYVWHALDLDGDSYDPGTATYLLCCSIMALLRKPFDGFGGRVHRSDRMKRSLHLVCEFLKRGAHPNFYVINSQPQYGEHSFSDFSDWKACHVTYIQKTVYTDHRHNLEGIASLKGRIEWDQSKMQNFRTRQEKTALCVLQESLSGTPRFEALQNACLSKGARSSSRFTHIALAEGYTPSFHYTHPDTPESGYYQVYEVTDRQYSKFEAAAIKYEEDSKLHREPESSRLRLKYALRIARIWKEISTNSGGSDSQDDSDEETTSGGTEEFLSSSLALRI